MNADYCSHRGRKRPEAQQQLKERLGKNTQVDTETVEIVMKNGKQERSREGRIKARPAAQDYSKPTSRSIGKSPMRQEVPLPN